MEQLQRLRLDGRSDRRERFQRGHAIRWRGPRTRRAPRQPRRHRHPSPLSGDRAAPRSQARLQNAGDHEKEPRHPRRSHRHAQRLVS